METREIARKEIEGLEVLAEGYKAVSYDNSTKICFKYAQNVRAL